jgi:hypothetical protein
MGTMEPAVTDPPCGKTTNVMKLSAVARATKIAISDSIIGENLGLFSVVSIFSLRQYYLVQVHWVDAAQASSQPAQLPAPRITLNTIALVSYLGVAKLSATESVLQKN